MTSNEPTAIGVFDDIDRANRSLDALRQAGFRAEEIGIIGNVGQDQTAVPIPVEMQVPEDAATQGILLGGIWGFVVGALVIVVIPALQWVSGIGRWFEILGGAVLGAAVGGPLFAFGSLLLSWPKSRRMARDLEHGRFIVTVKNPYRKEEAVSVLRRQGGQADASPN